MRPRQDDFAILPGMKLVLDALWRALAYCWLPRIMFLSLLPLVARRMLGGSAGFYGVMLGAVGAGAILGAVLLPLDPVSAVTVLDEVALEEQGFGGILGIAIAVGAVVTAIVVAGMGASLGTKAAAAAAPK